MGKTNRVRRKIMWGDLDSLGIVFYPRYYEWIDACGHLFFESIGLHMGRLLRERNLQFGLIETSCRYRRPGRYHVEIEIATSLVELKAKVLLLRHEIKRVEDAALLVEGFERRICLDVSDRDIFKAVEIPPDLFRVLESCLVP